MAKSANDEDDGPEIKSVYLAIGQQIRGLRQQRALSQKELAIRAGIRPSYMGEIEIVGVNLSLRLLQRIATALDATLRDLLPGSGDSKDYETSLRAVREKIHDTSKTLQLLEARYAELIEMVDSTDL